ncbi:RNB-domain-containing protein [Backusella circina FSU 941]|nr:RNB-domain-containing protein [Backusella circina FSU 941]
MNNHTSHDQQAKSDYWWRHEPDEGQGYYASKQTAMNDARQSSTQRNQNHAKRSNRSVRGPSMADQVDNWRSRSQVQKEQNIDHQQEAPRHNVYYSSKHTNGTTYYYSSNQLLHMQQQQNNYHHVTTDSNSVRNKNGHSNTESHPSNTSGANAQWRSHQTPQQSEIHRPDKALQQPRSRPVSNTPPKRSYYHPDDRPSPTRDSLYAPFLNPRDMENGLHNGTLYEGIFKVGRTRLDCYVVTDELEQDIYIGGNRDRNRAFHGDRVVVRLKDVEEGWKLKKERKERWRQRRRLQKREEMKKLNDDQSEQGDDDEESEEDSSYNEEDHKPKYCGEVVGIKYRVPGLSFSGTMSVFRDGSTDIDPSTTKMKIAWFRPLDKKVPLLVIPPKLVPTDLLENPGYYSSNCFVAEFKDWRIFEQSPNIASYKLIGPKGAFETEKRCIIQDNDISVHEFSKMALEALPSTPWIIPLQEYVKRRDLRTRRIFTIDPRTAKDLDDAVHIECEGGDEYEVGVHIADVTHFLKRNTPLDTEARERGTSTYFVDSVIPMLPPLLSEELCSLNPGVDRLVSTSWMEYGLN